MKRSLKAPNTAAQTVRGLEPGKLYSLKMMTGNYTDLMEGRSVKTNRVLRATLENAEVMADRSFIGITEAGSWKEWNGKAFGKNNPYCLNYHWTVFKAKGPEARLTIGDWPDERQPGGPEDQKTMCNFIQIQPYFAREREGR